MAVIAPWILRNNPLDFLAQGAHVGLAARAADQAQQRMAQEADRAAIAQQMAQQREDQDAQQAANLLRYHYDALSQARENSVRDDDFRKEDRSAARELKKAEDDALELYRQGVLKNQADRTEGMKTVADLRAGKPIHVGGNLLQFDPTTGSVKTLFSAPDKSQIARLSLPLDKDDPTKGKLSALANDSLINTILGTNAPTGTGTNFVMPKIAQKAMAVSPAPAVDEEDEDMTDAEPAAPAEAKALDSNMAKEFLKQAKGDKQKARQLARDAGYSF